VELEQIKCKSLQTTDDNTGRQVMGIAHHDPLIGCCPGKHCVLKLFTDKYT